MKNVLFLLTMCGLFSLAGCGGSGGVSATVPAAISLGGTVVKGLVSGSKITIYSLNANGSRGSVRTTTTSDVSGKWNVMVAVFPVEAVATGGSYVDEATGGTITITGIGMSSMIPAGRVQTAITPLTSAVVERIRGLVANGGALSQSITNAEAEITTSLGFNPVSTIPPSPTSVPATATAAEKEYALVLLGLSELANNAVSLAAARTGVGVFQTLMALADDLADGDMNAINLNGQGISVSSTVDLPVLGAGGANIINTAAQTLATNSNLPNLVGVAITSTPAATKTTLWNQFNWSGGAWN